MKEKNQPGIVPEQRTGIPIDTESSVELENEEQAKAFFEVVKQRLNDINRWHEIAGTLSTKFQLIDKNGMQVKRSPQKGDYFQIDIPGPGTVSGRGYDWVQVEEVESTATADAETFGLRVRPAQNPASNADTLHFYSRESTSSFVVAREKNKVTAAVYDRNTKPNKEAGSIIDKVRDAVIGTAGVLVFSKIQWKRLTDALVKKE
jgi:hypothetical protein